MTGDTAPAAAPVVDVLGLTRHFGAKRALNGVSLTVLALTPEGVRLSIIPHTWGATAFPELATGDPVNVEYDLIARYLKRLIEDRP